ncbi:MULTISPECIES: type III pantothenate kinase [unclassified Ruminococcus]|uniref:type III pantothenate kinase n=1 Tax=unclassified Ruminococcus TaxID=2608920 RepID=UPI00210B316F|nr:MULTISPECIES: type III pantothenate kinase [unclassified Ruminococcus]MCQ4022082.1 type III pantothenate kinase [Ruminococcus sp. zg-924]MCQ4114402.1 type III pantothenate kinase [Ruminococcus sp. zg-921]
MILVIDVGNTNIVLGCIENDNKIVYEARVATDHGKTEYQYAVEFKSLLEIGGIDVNQISGAIMSSVVPPLALIVKKAVNFISGVTPLIVGPGLKTGLNILLDNPAQLGSDQVVDAIAALNEYKPPIIIFDMGTATTVSVIDKNKNYLGGMIIPGVKISQDALTSRTSQLPKISIEAPKKNIGKNTIDCMKSGAIFANAAMVDGVVDRIEDELGYSTTVIATGGLSGSIIPFCKRNIIVDNDLLIKGLKILYDKNN